MRLNRLLTAALTALAATGPALAGEVEIVRDVAYAADGERTKLDLYLPKGVKNAPAVLYLHGGGFSKGDRKDAANVGEALARRGVAVAAAGYRLYPDAKHPQLVQDAARAFAWLKQNGRGHGIDTDALFVGGHSAGGHLTSLLASDARYLSEVGLGTKDVRGVVSLSGTYVVPEARKEVFGAEAARKQASPLTHVKAGLPAFFLAFAESDSPGRDKQTREFAEALKTAGVEAVVFEGKGRDHGSIPKKVGDDDATTEQVVAFVTRHARPAKR